LPGSLPESPPPVDVSPPVPASPESELELESLPEELSLLPVLLPPSFEALASVPASSGTMVTVSPPHA
jgi:hypothetical protein